MAFAQFATKIDGLTFTFCMSARRMTNALPIIITHGWPGSVIEFLEVIDPLTNPTAHGGRAEDAFHVVVPSLPGFGFSDKPAERGWNNARIARAWAELMRRLGYKRYVAQGGRLGVLHHDQAGAAKAAGACRDSPEFSARVSRSNPDRRTLRGRTESDRRGQALSNWWTGLFRVSSRPGRRRLATLWRIRRSDRQRGSTNFPGRDRQPGRSRIGADARRDT